MIVGIRDRFYVRGAGGAWSGRPRRMSVEGEPRIRGPVEPGRLPSIPGAFWTVVAVGPGGLGAASASLAGKGAGRGDLARFFLTRDGGGTWTELVPRLPLLTRFWGVVSLGLKWPPESIDDAISQDGRIVGFAWTDPWLHEGAKSHAIVSFDAGVTWRYRRSSEMAIEFAGGGGRLVRAFLPGQFFEFSAGPCRREDYTVESKRNPSLLRRIAFVSEDEGFALAVRDAAVRKTRVVLVRTVDGGRTWREIQDWPATGDLNLRHALSLEV